MPEAQEQTEVLSMPTGEWIYPFENAQLEQLEAPGENLLVYNIEKTNLFVKVILEDTPSNVEYIKNRHLRRKGLIVEMPSQENQGKKLKCYLKDAVGNTYKGIPETVDDKIIFKNWLREFPETPGKSKPQQLIRTVGTFKNFAVSLK